MKNYILILILISAAYLAAKDYDYKTLSGKIKRNRCPADIKPFLSQVPRDENMIVNASNKFVKSIMSKNGMDCILLKSRKDKYGYWHIRYKQKYLGYILDESQIIVHFKRDSTIYDITGHILPKPKYRPKPLLSDSTLFEKIKNQYLDSITIPKNVYHLEKKGEKVFIDDDLYNKIVLQNADNEDLVHFIINSSNGKIIQTYGSFGNDNAPSSNGYPENIAGYLLENEGGAQITTSENLEGWYDSDNQLYYLYNFGPPEASTAPWSVSELTDDLYSVGCTDCYIANGTQNFSNSTFDRAAISGAFNLQTILDYYDNYFGYFGYDGNGSHIRLYINVPGTGASSGGNGKVKTIEGDDVTKYNGAVLDLIGHEYTHNVIEESAGIIANVASGGENEWGGVREALCDIMGVSIELLSQPNGRNSYPDITRGCSDWFFEEDMYVGKDVSQNPPLPIALRDFRYPQRLEFGGAYEDVPSRQETLYDHENFLFIDPEVSGYLNRENTAGHTKAPALNFAYYLICEGNDNLRQNDGHTYGTFTGIGVENAFKIVGNAIFNYLTATPTFYDFKIAVEKQAQDLIDINEIPSNSLATLENAWHAIGLYNNLRFNNDYQYNEDFSSSTDLTRTMLGRNGVLKSSGYFFPTTTLENLTFVNNTTSKGICMSGGLTKYMGSANEKDDLLDEGNFNDGLLFTGPDGNPQMFISKDGSIYARNYFVNNFN
jgi:Zn-dependent metalloprotease